MSTENLLEKDKELNYLYSQFNLIAEMRSQQSLTQSVQLIYLSAGAIGLTIGMILEHKIEHGWQFLALISFLPFVLAIVFTILSFNSSDIALSARLDYLAEEINAKKNHIEKPDTSKYVIIEKEKVRVTRKYNLVSSISFITGIAILLLFIVFNYSELFLSRKPGSMENQSIQTEKFSHDSSSQIFYEQTKWYFAVENDGEKIEEGVIPPPDLK